MQALELDPFLYLFLGLLSLPYYRSDIVSFLNFSSCLLLQHPRNLRSIPSTVSSNFVQQIRNNHEILRLSTIPKIFTLLYSLSYFERLVS